MKFAAELPQTHAGRSGCSLVYKSNINQHVRCIGYAILAMLSFSFSNFMSQTVKAAKLPGVRALLISISVYLLAVQYCRLRFYRDPGSAFYDEKHAFVRWYSDYREHQAFEYVKAAAAQGDTRVYTKAGTSPKVCAAFVTIKRDSQQYVEVSYSSLLD